MTRLLQRSLPALGASSARHAAQMASPAAIAARDFVAAACQRRAGPWAPQPRCLVVARAASSASKAKQMFVCSECGEQAAQW